MLIPAGWKDIGRRNFEFFILVNLVDQAYYYSIKGRLREKLKEKIVKNDSYTEERSVHKNSESCNIRLGS